VGGEEEGVDNLEEALVSMQAVDIACSFEMVYTYLCNLCMYIRVYACKFVCIDLSDCAHVCQYAGG